MSPLPVLSLWSYLNYAQHLLVWLLTQPYLGLGEKCSVEKLLLTKAVISDTIELSVARTSATLLASIP